MALSLVVKRRSILINHLLSIRQPIVTRTCGMCNRPYSTLRKSAPILNYRLTFATNKRTFWSWFKKPTIAQLRKEDGLSSSCILIYKSTLHNYLFGAQFFTTVSAALAAILFGANIYYGKLEFGENPYGIDKEEQFTETEAFICLTALIALCASLQVMLKRLPIRIYTNPERTQYFFIFYGRLPFTRARLNCAENDVIKLEQEGVLPWSDSKYEIRDRKVVIMAENCFRKPADLHIMLGYQKMPEDYD